MDTIIKLDFMSTPLKLTAKSLGLSKTQFYILMAVGHTAKSGLKQMELIPLFGGKAGKWMDKGKMENAPMLISQALRGMIGDDMIRQEFYEDDRRVKILHLTNNGKKIYEKGKKLLGEKRKVLAKKLGTKNLKLLESLADQAAEALQDAS